MENAAAMMELRGVTRVLQLFPVDTTHYAMLRATNRLSFKMASCAPFTRAVVSSMRKLYPEAWADKSFDNTGLLLEAPFDPKRRQKNSVLLTIDLTKAVADEAIERQDSIIVTYRAFDSVLTHLHENVNTRSDPIIFRALKSLTLANAQQQSLLRLAAAGISVYSPHTAVDAAPGGLGDFLADIVTGSSSADEEPEDSSLARKQQPRKSHNESSDLSSRPEYALHHHPSQFNVQESDYKLNSQLHTRTAIEPHEHPSGSGAGVGMGRIVRFAHAQPLSHILARVRAGLGHPAAFPLAIPQGKQIADLDIRSVAICAGSGGSLLAGLDVDLLLTGELAHHDTLAATERGQSVIALFHSNSERGFLRAVLRAQLRAAVEREWRELREAEEEHVEEGLDEGYLDALRDETVRVDVSERDRDPFGIYMPDIGANAENL